MNDATSGKSRLALSVALATSIVFSAVALAGYLQTSSVSEEQSEVVARQENELEAQAGTVNGQKAEIDAKVAELAQVQSQIGALSQKLSETEAALQQETGRADSREAQVSSLNEQAGVLQTEITALQSKIQFDEKRIEELTSLNAESDRTTISHYGVGVDQDNQGRVFPIKVEIINDGTGILSVDINNVQYEPDFQTAVRAAAMAASKYSGVSIADKDIMVSFASAGTPARDELFKVDGSSAGTIIAAMIAAGLADRELDSSILVTGSINDEGIVGRIGGLEEKVAAADNFGAEAMLVPKSQEFESDLLPVIGVTDIKEVMARLTS